MSEDENDQGSGEEAEQFEEEDGFEGASDGEEGSDDEPVELMVQPCKWCFHTIIQFDRGRRRPFPHDAQAFREVGVRQLRRRPGGLRREGRQQEEESL